MDRGAHLGCNPDMRMNACRTVPELGRRVAAVVADVVATRPEAVIAWPSGRTAVPVVEALRGADLGAATFVLLDEYATDAGHNVEPGLHYSCAGWAETWLAPLRPARIVLPDASDPDGLERELKRLGGLDVALIGIGASDGHVAFNPPGTPADSRTRVLRIADTTRRDNLATFPDYRDLSEVPTQAVSVGLGTLLDARRLIAMAHGPDKASIMAQVRSAPGFDPQIPATFCHLHDNADLYVAP